MDKRTFVEFLLQEGVLKLGRFTLKSGRISPYFFNAGLISTGRAMGQLARAYADTLAQSDARFDMLFGPAYKGIPLVATTAVALAEHHDRDIPFVFNRKEAKDHGEGGVLVGAPLEGRVWIVDDVMTAGTAIRESIELIERQGAEPAGVIVALDRRERGQGGLSAVEEVSRQYGIPVISIITLDDIIEVLAQSDEPDHQAALEAMERYRSRYGVP